MTLDQITELFKWMTIINIGIFVISAVLSMVLRKIVCKIHGKLFGIEEDKVSIVVYGYFGVYRIAILVFNLIPYLSLLLIKS
jgi:hypothetical protein